MASLRGPRPRRLRQSLENTAGVPTWALRERKSRVTGSLTTWLSTITAVPVRPATPVRVKSFVSSQMLPGMLTPSPRKQAVQPGLLTVSAALMKSRLMMPPPLMVQRSSTKKTFGIWTIRVSAPAIPLMSLKSGVASATRPLMLPPKLPLRLLKLAPVQRPVQAPSPLTRPPSAPT